MHGMNPFTDDEYQAVLDELRTERDVALVVLGCKTGFRITELLSLTVSDVCKTDGTLRTEVTVMKRNMKGSKRGRTVKINANARGAIQRHLETAGLTNDEPLFKSRQGGKAISRVQAYRVINSAAERAGVEGRIGTHSLRKTFAHNVHNALGGDVTKTRAAMGHANIQTTVKYLQASASEINAAVEAL